MAPTAQTAALEPFALLPPVNQDYAAKADACIPELKRTEQKPLAVVTVEADSDAMLGWKAVPRQQEPGRMDMDVMHAGDSVILDFGGHRTGYLSFRLQPYKFGAEPADSPCRLRIIFGEILSDVAEPLEPYNAWLSRAWLPDEILNIDYLPQRDEVPRRHAFRYVKFEIIATSRRYGVKIEDAIATAVTSAPIEDPPALSFPQSGSSLSNEDKDLLRSIDKAALLTLRNCMLTVYEDGPRRDMRLWIGDLRLQALTNYTTFGDTSLAKRCLYLFAATPFREDGLLSASCYEKPHTCSGGQSIVDFSQIYAAALLDYVRASGDKDTGRDLFEVAKKQFEIAVARCSPETGLYTIRKEDEKTENGTGGDVWHFIDWHEELEKSCAEHCVTIFGLRSLFALSQDLSLPTPSLATPFSSDPIALPDLIDRMVEAARKAYYSAEAKCFVSGPSSQISWGSNAWAVMAGVPASQAIAAESLRTAYSHPDAIGGNTPYLHHYMVEAMILAGEKQLATEHILTYWGSMIKAGAETFWEAWDPKRPTFSPYGDFHSNSFCHAWSCTPALLLRRLGYA